MQLSKVADQQRELLVALRNHVNSYLKSVETKKKLELVVLEDKLGSFTLPLADTKDIADKVEVNKALALHVTKLPFETS